MSALTAEVEITEAPTALYRCYDADGALLYVGISGNLCNRFRQHAKRSHWWTNAVRKTVEWFSSRSEGETAERIAIHDEHPAHNIQRRRIKKKRVGPAGTVSAQIPRKAPDPARDGRPYVFDPRPSGPFGVLYEARIAKGLSLAAVARLCSDRGVPIAAITLGRLERAQCLPSPRYVPALTEILGISVTDFYLLLGAERTKQWRARRESLAAPIA